MPNAPLYLEDGIREEIAASESTPENAEKLRLMPTMQLLYYSTAIRLARTLEHVMLDSLHYSRRFVEDPGREAVDNVISELKKTARLCLGPISETSGGLIEISIKNVISVLPFTWSDELLKEPESFLAVSQSEVDGLISQDSSGTTRGSGNYKRIFCTKNDLESTVNFFMHGVRYLVRPGGDRVALLLSAGGRGGGNLADLFGEAMRRLDIPCLVPKNMADECACLRELAAFGPTCLVSTPRQAISILRSAGDENCPESGELAATLKSGLKSLLLSGDRISSAVNQLLTREIGADIFMHYGLVETGLGMAVECGCRNGCHFRQSEFLVEIVGEDGVSYPSPISSREAVYIDPDNVKDGRIFGPTPWGEITITSLTREGTPLIRYRTGDYGRVIVDRCACGSVIWRLEVQGRVGDYIALPGKPGGAAPARHLTHSVFDRPLYALPWVKDHQVFIHAKAGGKGFDLGINVLVNAAAPDWAEASVRKALAKVESDLTAHGSCVYVKIMRDRRDFLSTFEYSYKRSFTRTDEPIDPALYVSP